MLGYTNGNDWNVSIIALDALALLIPLYHEKTADQQKVYREKFHRKFILGCFSTIKNHR